MRALAHGIFFLFFFGGGGREGGVGVSGCIQVHLDRKICQGQESWQVCMHYPGCCAELKLS